MDYWHYAWACPYFVWDEQKRIGCASRCIVSFSDPRLLQRFAKTYCTSVDGYRRCAIAEMNEQIFYEKEEREKIINEAKRQAERKGNH